jgi:hypothetical protein
MHRSHSPSLLTLVLLLLPLLAGCSGKSPHRDVFGPVPASADAGVVPPPPAVLRIGAEGTPTTAENGKRATMTIALSRRPSDDVVVPLASSNEAEIKIEPSAVTFGTDDWEQPRTITLVGQDDLVSDGDRRVKISFGPATSKDASMSGLRADAIEAVNEDDDGAGLVVSQASPTNATTESSGTATFTVRLKSRPMAQVNIGVSSSVPTEATVDKTSLAFGPDNWQTDQTVTVTGVDDAVADGDTPFTVVLAKPESNDVAYAALAKQQLSFTNLDDDIPGFFVFPPAPGSRTTTEAGGKITFGIRLRSKPTADVTIAVTSSKPAEGQPSPATLVFTPADHDDVQTVTVTGQDDFVDDGDQPYTIVLAAATSTDAEYAGLDPADLDLTNADDDAAAVLVSAPSPSAVTTEAGGPVTFTVKLASQPTAPVTIAISSSKPTEGAVDLAQVAFDADTWNVAQTVTVTGQDDFVDDGDEAYAIVLAQAVSTDAKYAAIDPANVALTNSDNDAAGVTVSTPSPSNQTTEGLAKVTVTVVLKSQPTSDVTIPVSIDKTAEASADKSTLTFTTENWNVAQTITVTGKNDDVDDGDVEYHLVLGAASGGGYAGIDPADTTLSNVDDDTAGIDVSSLSGTKTTELGGAVTFTVVLKSRPAGTATVSIPISTTPTAEAQPDKTTLTFLAAEWNLAQTVTVTGKNDGAIDDDATFDIVLGAATSADSKYAGINPPDFTGVVNTSACGIGGVNAGEQCDDANANTCDGCERCVLKKWARFENGESALTALAIPFADPACIEAWVRLGPASGGHEYKSLFGLVNGGASTMHVIFDPDYNSVPGSNLLQVDASGVQANATGVPAADGAFHHIAACKTTAATDVTLRLYFDGTEVASGTGPAASNATTHLRIGGNYLPDGNPQLGYYETRIDEVRVSSVDRYAATSFTPVRHHAPDASTLVLYRFDEASGDGIVDSSGNARGTTGTFTRENDTGYTTAMCQ